MDGRGRAFKGSGRVAVPRPGIAPTRGLASQLDRDVAETMCTASPSNETVVRTREMIDATKARMLDADDLLKCR
jgi:hypothetical protein